MMDDPSHCTEDPPLIEKSRGTRKNYRETTEEKHIRRMLEKQRQAQGMQATQQQLARMESAKTQIVAATSASDLLEKAELLIEEDWLGQIDAMPGNMYFIGAFGALTKGSVTCDFDWLKARARHVGCIVIALTQLVSPPIVFLSTITDWGITQGQKYQWTKWDPSDYKNSLSDWEHVKVKKCLGMLLMTCFILNGVFVVADGKQVWFKIYNMFQYIERSTPNFAFSATNRNFLFFAAFIKCWTVLWCTLCSYVIIGASATPKDVLLDSLGMLFLYNLDSIGGELGFVDSDDWPGARLGWIFAEMARKDWQPLLETTRGEVCAEARPTCVKACGRYAATGHDAKGRTLDTCCRGCGLGGAHDDECNEAHLQRRRKTGGSHGGEGPAEPGAADDDHAGGETGDWGCGGWFVLAAYNCTIVSLAALALVLPVLSAWTPFHLIVPDLIEGN